MSSVRCRRPLALAAGFRLALIVGLGLAPALAWAQIQPGPSAGAGELVLHAYTFKHRKASDAVSVVYPLLSRRGTVELQPASNTLVIRDSSAALTRIVPALRAYDHPSRPLTLEIWIVRAERSRISGGPPPRSDLPEALTRRLRALLPYDVYEVQAQAQLGSWEGQAITYVLGGEYEVSFRLGTVLADRAGERRVRLSDLRILRRSDERRTPAQLIHTNLTLPIAQTTTLGLARTEQSPEALMVLLTLRDGNLARRP